MFFREDYSDKAIGLFDGLHSGAVKLAIPDLLPIEFVNILWVKLRRGEANQTDCLIALESLIGMLNKLQIVASAGFAREIFDASVRHKHPAYDMTFLVIADSLGVPFITADANHSRKIPGHSPIVLLSNLTLDRRPQ